MQPVLINPDLTLLNRQYQVLIRREFYVRFNWVIKATYLFLGWTAALTCFAVFAGQGFLTLKIVLFFLTALFAIVAIIFYFSILVIWVKRLNWKKSAIKKVAESKSNYWLKFDDSQISFEADTFSSNIKWEYYKYYQEYKDSIFIFPDSIYDAVFWSRSEIGQENYCRLKEIAEAKLTMLH